MAVADDAQAFDTVLLGPRKPNAIEMWAAVALFMANTTVRGLNRATFCSSKAVYAASVEPLPPLPVPMETPNRAASKLHRLAASARPACAMASRAATNASWLTRSMVINLARVKCASGLKSIWPAMTLSTPVGKVMSSARIPDVGDSTAAKKVSQPLPTGDTIPSVKKGDRILGVYRPGAGATFLVNGKPVGEILDLELAHLFFGIWLSPTTSEPKLRSALLAGAV